MPISFSINAQALHDANEARIQAQINDANGRIISVMEAIGDNPTASVHEKVQALEGLATVGEAFARGQITMPNTQPAAAPAALGTAPAQPPFQSPAPTPSAPNVADQQRIAELEGTIKDLASMLGISVPLTAGKFDLVRFKTDAQKAINAKASAPAAASTDVVPKADVKKIAQQVREATKGLKSGALRGNHIDGLDEVKHQLDELDKLVK